MQLAPHHATRRSLRPVERQMTVCVVDPRSQDYQDWATLAQTNRLRLQILANAEEALRRVRLGGVDLWVINAELPGLSGYELCSMLRSRSSSRTPICLVADEYSLAAERAAWAARATMFLCKGEHAGWLSEWLDRRPRSARLPVHSPTVGNRSGDLPLRLLVPDPPLQTLRA